MEETPRPNPEPPIHGPEPADIETTRIGKRRRRRQRHRRRTQTAQGPQLEMADEPMISGKSPETPALNPRLAREERPFLRAVLNDEGEIRYRMRTRQRIGAKYLLREVFD